MRLSVSISTVLFCFGIQGESMLSSVGVAAFGIKMPWVRYF